VLVAVIVNVPAFEMFTLCDDKTPAEKVAVVPLPEPSEPVEVISTEPVKLLAPLLHMLFSASRAVIMILKETEIICVPIFPPEVFCTRKLFNTAGYTVTAELAIPVTVPSVTVMVVVSAFFNDVVRVVVDAPLVKLTEVIKEGMVTAVEGPE